MKPLFEMPNEPPQDLAHARWRVRFFKHLVEEHRAHELPETGDSQWAAEDASYAEQLAKAQEVLAMMEAEAEEDGNDGAQAASNVIDGNAFLRGWAQ